MIYKSDVLSPKPAGLGYQCALSIARKHPEYQIVLASRSDPDSSADKANSLLGQSNVGFRRLDLSSIDNVRSFATNWEHNGFAPIHALVFKAALQFPGDIEYTESGYEKTFAISHIGDALLLSLLRPHLADTARIVIVSSGTHDPAQKSGMPHPTYNSAEELAHPTPDSAKSSGRQRYTSTKLANVLYAYALHRRFTAINENSGKHWTVTAFDPGLMPGTGLARKASGVEKFLWNRVLPKILPLLRLIISHNVHTPEESGEALALLAVGTSVAGKSGLYYEGRNEIKSSEMSYDQVKQEDLWQWTVSTLAQNEREQEDFNLHSIL